MTTAMAAVNSNNIEHGTLIDLTIDGTTYYISNLFKTVTVFGRTYTALAAFLNISDIQSNLASTNDEIQISLSGLDDTYLGRVIDQKIKGGSITIYRVFIDPATQEIKLDGAAPAVYPRFKGIITNWNVSEDINVDGQTGTTTHTIVVMASSVLGVLENRIAGRRTNRRDYQRQYSERFITGSITTDPSMNRVEALFNASFDFGKPYTGGAASPGTGNNTGGFNKDQVDQVEQP